MEKNSEDRDEGRKISAHTSHERRLYEARVIAGYEIPDDFIIRKVRR